MGLPFAHVSGIPIEETLGTYGPALLVIGGLASARLSVRFRQLRGRRRIRAIRKSARTLLSLPLPRWARGRRWATLMPDGVGAGQAPR